jgi:hypothetical protein
MKVLGKDLRLVKLNEEISGKEKVWLRMILKEPWRNFLKLYGSRSAEGEERWQQAGRKFKKMCGVRKRTL